VDNNINIVQSENRLNNVYKFRFHLTENIMLLHVKDQMVNNVRDVVIVLFEKHTKCINTPCGQNAEYLKSMVHIVTTCFKRLKSGLKKTWNSGSNLSGL
jgi:hypothetical protein